MVKSIPMLLDQGHFLNDSIMTSEAREEEAARGLSSAGETDPVSSAPNPAEYLAAEMRISRDETFQGVNQCFNNFLRSFSQGMDSLANIAHELRMTMTTVMTDGNGMTQVQFNDTIDRLMNQLQTALLTKYNERMYVFSGENTSRPPVGDLSALAIPTAGSLPNNNYYVHKDNDTYMKYKASQIDNQTITLTAGDDAIQGLIYAVGLARGVNLNATDKSRGLEVLRYADSSVKAIPAAGRRVNEVIKSIDKTTEDLKAAQARNEAVAKEAGFISMETRYMEMFKNRTLAKVGREIAAMSTRDIMELAKAIAQ